jgi:hypothetical protein
MAILYILGSFGNFFLVFCMSYQEKSGNPDCRDLRLVDIFIGRGQLIAVNGSLRMSIVPNNWIGKD